MLHALKTETEFFRKVVSGEKTFEVRKNDRNFHIGDYLALNETSTEGETEYTGAFCVIKITYILDNPKYCLEGFIIIGFEPCAIRLRNNHMTEDCYIDNGWAVPIYGQQGSEKHAIKVK